LRTPHRRWAALEGALPDAGGTDGAAALLLYLAGPAPARDIDPAAPLRCERSNIGWYAGSTVERMRTLLPEGAPPRIAADLALSAEERALVKSAVLLPLRLRFAALGAEVDRFLAALDGVTAAYQRYMHVPAR